MAEFKMSGEMARTLVEMASEGIWLLDEHDRVTFVNPKMAELLGYSSEEMVGRSFLDFVHESIKETAARRLKLRRLGARGSYESCLRRKDGTSVPTIVSGAPIFDEAGRYFSLLAVHTDITKRKQAEEALKHSSEFAGAVLDSTNDAVSIIATHDFRILGVNRAFLQQYGLREEEVLGKTCHEVTHHRATPCSAPDDICPLVAAASSGGHSMVEHVRYAPDGRKVYVEVSATPIVENGVVTRVVHVSRDITERKKTEEELRVRADLLDAATDSILVHDMDGNLHYANETAWKTRGYARDEIMGMTLRDLLVPEYAAFLPQRMQQLAETGEAIIYESAHFRKDGSVMSVEVHSRLINWGDRQLVLASVRDTTRRKQAEQEIQRRNRELAAINDVMAAVTSSLNLKEVLDIALQKSAAIVGAEGGWIRLLNEEGDKLVLAAHRGIPSTFVAAMGVATSIRGGLAGIAKSTGRPVVVEDIERDNAMRLKEQTLAEGWRSEAAIPLLSSKGFLGVLTLVSRERGRIGPEREWLLTTVATQVGLAVERARLFGEVERRNQELEAINSVIAAGSGSLQLGEIQRIALEKTAEVIGAEGGWIRLLNEEGDSFDLSGWRGISEALLDRLRGLQIGLGGAGLALKSGKSLFFGDITQGKSLTLWREMAEDGWRSHIAAPLWGKEGIAGSLVMVSRAINKFDSRDLRLLEMVASQIALAVEKARLFGEVERHNKELAALNAVTAAVSSSLDLKEVLEIALERTGAVLGAGRGWVRLLDEEGDSMVIAAYFGVSGEVADLAPTGPLQGGLAGHAMKTGRAMLAEDIEAQRALLRKGSLLAEGWRSLISVPLKSPTAFLGILTFYSREKEAFGPDSERLLQMVASQIGLAVQKARLYENMKHRAVTNWLTGLYNRGHFEDRLAQELDRAARSGNPLAVVMMDVNDFKHFNDAYGHLAGDKVLQAVASAIRAGVRSFDIAARYGGDEFSLVLPNTDETEAQRIVARVQEAVKEATAGIVPDVDLEISLSAGIACSHPETTPPHPTAVVEAADRAMYIAKRQGGGIQVAPLEGYGPSIPQ